MSKTLYISTTIVTLLIGIAIGYAISPSYQSMKNEKESMSMELGPADRNVDLRYIDGMIAHHLNAIYMARQAEQSHRREIRDLSATIIRVDEKGIEDLYALKKKLYNDTRPITEYEKINLGELDEDFDLRFINALLIHHEDAIDTAKDARTKSKRTEILSLADEVIQGLSSGAQTLRAWRKEWYNL